jgi:polyisoprenoid-binding protein YceI
MDSNLPTADRSEFATQEIWWCTVFGSRLGLIDNADAGRTVSTEGTQDAPHQRREGAMRKVLIASIVALMLDVAAATAEPAAQPAGTYKIDHAHSSLTWKVNHFGLSNYTARFTRFDAILDIDPAKPEGAKVFVSLDPTSARTDYRSADGRDFDKELGEAEKYFNAKKFDQIIFASTRVERTGETTARVIGELTMRGVTKPLTIEATLNGAKQHPTANVPALGFSGIAKLKRSDFDLTFMLPLVGDEVTLLIEAEFLKSETQRPVHAR